MAIPPAEHHIDEALVRRLLGSQCPDLAELPLQFGAAGWDNQMVRVGDRHVPDDPAGRGVDVDVVRADGELGDDPAVRRGGAGTS